MNYRILSLGAVALALASTAAFADVHLNVDLNPFGWGAPPPVVYESPRYYAPPPVVYNGRGHWGEQRGQRGRDQDRGRWDHQTQGRDQGRHDEGHHDEGDRQR
jgi:hypothetical protein